MTRSELIYNIKELMKDHSDDVAYSDRHIAFLIDLQRARFIRKSHEKRSKALDQACMSSIEVNLSKITGPLGNSVTRSDEELPELLSLNSRTALVSVVPTISGAEPIEIVSLPKVRGILKGAYGTLFGYMEDNYLNLISLDPAVYMLKKVKVRGIFSELPFVSDDDPYPLSASLVPQVEDAVLADLLKTLRVMQLQDTDNDSTPKQIDG